MASFSVASGSRGAPVWNPQATQCVPWHVKRRKGVLVRIPVGLMCPHAPHGNSSRALRHVSDAVFAASSAYRAAASRAARWGCWRFALYMAASASARSVFNAMRASGGHTTVPTLTLSS